MREINIPTANFAENTKQLVLTDESKRRRWVAILYISGISGIMFDVIGLFISSIGYFHIVKNAREITHIGTWMMVAAFPLLMFGAHAMDKISEFDRAAKQNALQSGKR